MLNLAANVQIELLQAPGETDPAAEQVLEPGYATG
jgi:hypothetical protein